MSQSMKIYIYICLLLSQAHKRQHIYKPINDNSYISNYTKIQEQLQIIRVGSIVSTNLLNFLNIIYVQL